MEQYFLQFLNVYFWVYIIIFIISIISILYMQTDEYVENKKYAIKNGNINTNILESVIGWTIFILSVILT